MSLTTGMFTSMTGEWATPQDLFDALNREHGPFLLDPAATHENRKAPFYFTAEDDGLRQIWRGRVFLNPPYGRGIGAWVRKAWESAQDGAYVVCLLPARTDTAWWWDYCAKGDVEFLKGRVRFGGGKNSAPFPSAVVIFRPEPAL